jgi:hypothetical protein
MVFSYFEERVVAAGARCARVLVVPRVAGALLVAGACALLVAGTCALLVSAF